MTWPNFRRGYEAARESGALLPIAILVTLLVCGGLLICAASSWIAEVARGIAWRDGVVALGLGAAIAAAVVLFALAVSALLTVAIGAA